MNKDDLINSLKDFRRAIERLRRNVRKEQSKQIRRKAPRDEAIRISIVWTDEMRTKLIQFGLTGEIITYYDDALTRLRRLGLSHASKNSWEDVFSSILRPFRRGVLEPVIGFIQETLDETENDWDDLFPDVTGAEKVYLQESFSCAKAGWYRAATVVAWCAAADRMQRVVEGEGFDRFNKDAKVLNKKKGRYSRFNQSLEVSDLADYRYVNDSNTLLILVYVT